VEVIEAIVADTNAIVDLLRDDRPDPEPLHRARTVFLPLPAIGELYAGAHYSRRVSENLAHVENVIAAWQALVPNIETARIYGRLRGSAGDNRMAPSRLNDLWIAALCIEHSLPLLTNDRGFASIPELTVISW
jgi:tRNA(fMet)-specific endonuclease VapC